MRRVVRAAALGWTLAIFVLLWMPPPPPPELVWPWWDSLVHSCLLAAFGGLWTWAGRRGAWVLVAGVLVGAVTELGQDLLPWERHTSLGDFAFDVLGLVSGWLLARGAWPRALGSRPRRW
ncbi:VanZ family protein [Paraliomyxa miuraensis]|uniref:hypothetical protein n=1 Tax=Paraliomyxa miuraensis TaxID=376150 RepID=UPI00224F0836|nr:hypothetical protein [Paraliomyxa miuraensis]MCX4247608.1 hypothetical protein [Paraliomyxa miuraensis]